MGWLIAIVIVGLIIGGLVGGTVLHPFLYGLFVAALIFVPAALFSLALDGIFNAIFGRRK